MAGQDKMNITARDGRWFVTSLAAWLLAPSPPMPTLGRGWISTAMKGALTLKGISAFGSCFLRNDERN